MSNKFLMFGAAFGFLSVALGAFGAHALKATRWNVGDAKHHPISESQWLAVYSGYNNLLQLALRTCLNANKTIGSHHAYWRDFAFGSVVEFAYTFFQWA